MFLQNVCWLSTYLVMILISDLTMNYISRIWNFTFKDSKFLLTNSVHTSQETHHFSPIETSRLMLFREVITVYCENNTKHTDALCGQNAEF
jgi:hypothetical protein